MWPVVRRMATTANLPAAWQTGVAMASEHVHQTSGVLCARTSFLSDDERPSAVRPEIIASWRRSALLGAQPTSQRCRGHRDTNHLRLWRQLTKRKPARDSSRLGGRQGERK
jgi:hypothetical protein